MLAGAFRYLYTENYASVISLGLTNTEPQLHGKRLQNSHAWLVR